MKKLIKKYYNSNKEITHNFIWRALQIIGKQGITFYIFILCAKILSPYDFGIYNYSLTVVYFLIMFGDFGISTATSKYVSEYNIINKEKLKSILFNSGIIILILTILITVLTLTIGPGYLKEKYIYVLYLLPLIFLAPMTSLYDGIYRGLKKFKRLALISLITGAFSIGFIYFFVQNYGLIGALIIQNIFYLVLLVSLGFGYREFNFKFDKDTVKNIVVYGFTFGLAMMGYYLFSRIGVLILGYYNYINEIAVYELLNKIFIIILMPLTVIGTVVAPNFTEYYIQKKYELILLKFKKYFIIFFVLAIIFTFLSYLILPLIFSVFLKEYYNSLFSVMLIPVTIFYSSLVYGTVINIGIIIATGHVKIMSYSNIILGVGNVILSLILINYFGFMTVIYATLIFHMISIIFCHTAYYIKIKNLTKETAGYNIIDKQTLRL